MIKNKKHKQLKEGRLVIVADLYKKGLGFRKIAEQVKVRMNLDKEPSISTISSDVKSLLNEWRKARITDMDLLITLELARIDDILLELWEAWEKSKTDRVIKGQKKKGVVLNGDNKSDAIAQAAQQIINEIEQNIKTEGRNGNPAYISEIRAQLDDRRKLLGIYQPSRINLAGNNGGPIEVEHTDNGFDLQSMPDELLEQLYKYTRVGNKKA